MAVKAPEILVPQPAGATGYYTFEEPQVFETTSHLILCIPRAVIKYDLPSLSLFIERITSETLAGKRPMHITLQIIGDNVSIPLQFEPVTEDSFNRIIKIISEIYVDGSPRNSSDNLLVYGQIGEKFADEISGQILGFAPEGLVNVTASEKIAVQNRTVLLFAGDQLPQSLAERWKKTADEWSGAVQVQSEDEIPVDNGINVAFVHMGIGRESFPQDIERIKTSPQTEKILGQIGEQSACEINHHLVRAFKGLRQEGTSAIRPLLFAGGPEGFLFNHAIRSLLSGKVSDLDSVARCEPQLAYETFSQIYRPRMMDIEGYSAGNASLFSSILLYNHRYHRYDEEPAPLKIPEPRYMIDHLAGIHEFYADAKAQGHHDSAGYFLRTVVPLQIIVGAEHSGCHNDRVSELPHWEASITPYLERLEARPVDLFKGLFGNSDDMDLMLPRSRANQCYGGCFLTNKGAKEKMRTVYAPVIERFKRLSPDEQKREVGEIIALIQRNSLYLMRRYTDHTADLAFRFAVNILDAALDGRSDLKERFSQGIVTGLLAVKKEFLGDGITPYYNLIEPLKSSGMITSAQAFNILHWSITAYNVDFTSQREIYNKNSDLIRMWQDLSPLVPKEKLALISPAFLKKMQGWMKSILMNRKMRKEINQEGEELVYGKDFGKEDDLDSSMMDYFLKTADEKTVTQMMVDISEQDHYWGFNHTLLPCLEKAKKLFPEDAFERIVQTAIERSHKGPELAEYVLMVFREDDDRFKIFKAVQGGLKVHDTWRKLFNSTHFQILAGVEAVASGDPSEYFSTMMALWRRHGLEEWRGVISTGQYLTDEGKKRFLTFALTEGFDLLKGIDATYVDWAFYKDMYLYDDAIHGQLLEAVAQRLSERSDARVHDHLVRIFKVLPQEGQKRVLSKLISISEKLNDEELVLWCMNLGKYYNSINFAALLPSTMPILHRLPGIIKAGGAGRIAPFIDVVYNRWAALFGGMALDDQLAAFEFFMGPMETSTLVHEGFLSSMIAGILGKPSEPQDRKRAFALGERISASSLALVATKIFKLNWCDGRTCRKLLRPEAITGIIDGFVEGMKRPSHVAKALDVEDFLRSGFFVLEDIDGKNYRDHLKEFLRRGMTQNIVRIAMSPLRNAYFEAIKDDKSAVKFLEDGGTSILSEIVADEMMPWAVHNRAKVILKEIRKSIEEGQPSLSPETFEALRKAADAVTPKQIVL